MIRRSNPSLLERFANLQRARLFMSPIVLGELQVGYFKGDRSPKREQVLNHIVENSQLLILDEHVAKQYAMLRAQLELAGTPIGPNDTWIAAEALHHKLVVITDNHREFERVKGLQVENWL